MNQEPTMKPKHQGPPLKGGRGDVRLLWQVSTTGRKHPPYPPSKGDLPHAVNTCAGTAEPYEFSPGKLVD